MTSVNNSNRPDAAPEEPGLSPRPSPGAAVEQWQDWVDGPQPDQRPSPEAADAAGGGAEGGPASALTVNPAASVVPPLVSPPLVLVETAFLASTTSLLWLINAYFPVGPIWRICMPIPIALVYLRWHRRAAWMTAGVSGLLLMVFMGPVRSLFFLMPYGALGVLLGYCWRRRANWAISIGLGTLVNALGFFFKVALTSVLLGEDLWIYVTTQVTKILNWISINLGLLIQADLTLVQLLAIALVLLNSIIYLFVVHLSAWYLLDRLGAKVPPPPRWVQVMLELEVE